MLAARYDAARADFERVLKQRNALLRPACATTTTRRTLDVFDEQLVRAGAELVRGRLRLVERLVPAVATRPTPSWPATATVVDATYEAEWAPSRSTIADAGRRRGCSARALVATRRAEIDRGRHARRARTATSGGCTIDGLDARTQASQGEQRTLALALRLGRPSRRARAHRHAAGAAARRRVQRARRAAASSALVAQPAAGQTLLTTAGVSRRTSSPIACCASTPGARRERPASVTRLTRSDAATRVTARRSRCRSRDALAACRHELGLPEPDVLARARPTRGRDRRRRRRARTRALDRVRDGGARSRSTDRCGRPSCGTSNGRSSSAPNVLGPGVVTRRVDVAVRVERRDRLADYGREIRPHWHRRPRSLLVHWGDRKHPL